MDNIIIADFSESRDVIASGRYQYDYGQIYKPVGVELPDNYEVHFGNEFVNESYTVLGNADGALVPDVLFTTGLNILAWIFLHDGTDDGRTVYRAYIPIARRSAVTDTPPTPEEQSAITQAIALMQEYLEQMPTKTSDLENDGDGTDEHSPFATQAWVTAQGLGGDKFYKHEQRTPAAVWTITHNLDKMPSVSVVDSAESVVIGEVEYLDNNNLTVTFRAAFSGCAYLN